MTDHSWDVLQNIVLFVLMGLGLWLLPGGWKFAIVGFALFVRTDIFPHRGEQHVAPKQPRVATHA